MQEVPSSNLGAPTIIFNGLRQFRIPRKIASAKVLLKERTASRNNRIPRDQINMRNGREDEDRGNLSKGARIGLVKKVLAGILLFSVATSSTAFAAKKELPFQTLRVVYHREITTETIGEPIGKTRVEDVIYVDVKQKKQRKETTYIWYAKDGIVKETRTEVEILADGKIYRMDFNNKKAVWESWNLPLYEVCFFAGSVKPVVQEEVLGKSCAVYKADHPDPNMWEEDWCWDEAQIILKKKSKNFSGQETLEAVQLEENTPIDPVRFEIPPDFEVMSESEQYVTSTRARDEMKWKAVGGEPERSPFNTLKMTVREKNRWVDSAVSNQEHEAENPEIVVWYFDFGQMRKREEVKNLENPRIDALFIYDGRKVYSIDKRTKVAAENDHPLVLSDFFFQRPEDAKLLGQMELLGRKCDVYESTGVYGAEPTKVRSWVWNGILVKSEEKGGDLTRIWEATEIEENPPVAPGIFEVPHEVEIRGMDWKPDYSKAGPREIFDLLAIGCLTCKGMTDLYPEKISDTAGLLPGFDEAFWEAIESPSGHKGYRYIYSSKPEGFELIARPVSVPGDTYFVDETAIVRKGGKNGSVVEDLKKRFN